MIDFQSEVKGCQTFALGLVHRYDAQAFVMSPLHFQQENFNALDLILNLNTMQAYELSLPVTHSCMRVILFGFLNPGYPLSPRFRMG
ncbi:hypothetical protein [Noviherbaspirillum pedocola]|uniref:Uncharacterized protein n=1 Tax=Noviherbaspirillum pedocola TaxID=2801341 RepID=A0A934T459_9BURK|nr:hypothetical protein [Noviherbaspirillum pedocola]MBK4738653.1 hypothetical protein [Noviherbaspirillum pedocola]